MKKLFLLVLTITMVSCASKKDIVYFQGDVDLKTTYEQSVPKIRPNDMLSINVSAADMKATQVFNLQSPLMLRNGNSEIAQQYVYTVGLDGTIDYPVLGKVQVAGLTRQQAIDLFKEKLSDGYIVDPGVNINFTNFKISVIGEVSSPGTFTLPNERITILEALALAGDLTIQGKRNNVMVIREVNGEKKTFTIDLTQKQALDSPVYYLAQNDVIYVEPNKTKVQSSVVNYPVFISVAGIIISVVSLLIKL